MDKEFKDFILPNRQKTNVMNGWYIIDSTVAKHLLDLNEANYRAIRRDRVNAFANEMKQGKWKKNGQTIVVGKSGKLQDGQHRLHAVIKSNSVIVAFIIFDADETNVYDIGLARSIKSMFNAAQVSVSNLCIGGGRNLLYYGSSSECYGNVAVFDYVYDRIELLKKAENIVSTGYNTRSQIKPIARKSSCITVVYSLLKTGEVSEADMREFFIIANSGNDVGSTRPASPALMYRNQMLAMFSHGGGHGPQKFHLEITYKALCEFKNGNIVVKPYSYNSDDALRLVQKVYEQEAA